jgi:hypothetical protein
MKKAAAGTHLITLSGIWESKLGKALLSSFEPGNILCITFGAECKLLIVKPLRKSMGGFRTLSTEKVMYFSTIDEQRGVDLVKLADGHSKEITQHELEDSAGDLSPGGSFIGCAGRCGGCSLHAASACGCAASPARINPAACFPYLERDARCSGTKKDRRGRAGG